MAKKKTPQKQPAQPAEAKLTEEQRAIYEKLRKTKQAGAYKAALLAGNTEEADRLAATVADATPGEETSKGSTAEEVAKQLEDAKAWGSQFANQYITPDTFRKIDEATSPEMQAFLQALKTRMDTAGQYTGLENEALGAQRNAMQQGYAAPEMQAFREAALQEINRDLMNRRNMIMNDAARFGVRGPAATAQMQDAATENTMARGNLERDLFVKNADYMERSRNAFSNLVRQTEDARFGRMNQAEQNYGTTLGNEDASRQARQMFNINQDTNKGLTQSSLALSGAGLYAGQYGNQQALDEARRQAEANMAWQKTVSESQERMYNKFLEEQRNNINRVSSNVG